MLLTGLWISGLAATHVRGIHKSVNGRRMVGAGIFPVGVGSLDKQSGKAQMNHVGLDVSLGHPFELDLALNT